MWSETLNSHRSRKRSVILSHDHAGIVQSSVYVDRWTSQSHGDKTVHEALSMAIRKVILSVTSKIGVCHSSIWRLSERLDRWVSSLDPKRFISTRDDTQTEDVTSISGEPFGMQTPSSSIKTVGKSEFVWTNEWWLPPNTGTVEQRRMSGVDFVMKSVQPPTRTVQRGKTGR